MRAFGTASKTDCFREAVKVGWLTKRKDSDRKTDRSPLSVVRLTPKLEATTGEGKENEILNKLVDAESAEAERRQWKNMSSEERQELLASQEADMANDPSPLESGPPYVRNRSGH